MQRKVIAALLVLAWLGGVITLAAAASEPLFKIAHGDIAQLNMTVTQQVDYKTDPEYYIGSPVNITVRDQVGNLLRNATVIIEGHNTHYTNLTDENGTVTYTFNESEITQGAQKIAVRASCLHYPHAEKLIWVGYAGVLNIEQANTAVEVEAVGLGANKMNIDFTSVVVDTANESAPEKDVNVTAVVVDTLNLKTDDTKLYWLTEGSGNSAFIPKSITTDENGEATFGVHIEQDGSGDVELTIEMTATKEAYMPANSSSAVTIFAQGHCFIATAAYGSPVNENLDTLRTFRDTILLTNPPGTMLVGTYYVTSPPIANALVQDDGLRAATRLFLITPLVYSSALCLNTAAVITLTILFALTLFIFRRKTKVLLKSVGCGALTLAAFTVTVFTLGAIGYELPVCAAIGAYLLPVIIPASLCFCVLEWLKTTRVHRIKPFSFKNRMKELIRDEKAVSITLEYALLISICLTIMVIAVGLFNGLVTDASKLSITEQYVGLGNQLSGTINDMYLSGCNASRTFKIPFQIGDKQYRIEANATDYFGRQAIKIYSTDVEVFVPLNIKGKGNSNVTVTGNVSSIHTTKVRVTKMGDEITIANI